jgi:hypothetical protein
MEASCTFVASVAWIDHAIVFGSLTVALVGYGILLNLRGRRLKTELVNDGEVPEPEVSMARA